jgi:3-oxoacyl-[acyl-carrier-protein] synthase III
MQGITEIIATAEVAPKEAEMVSNRQVIDELLQAGVEIPDRRVRRYTEDGFHGIETRWKTSPTISSFDLAVEAGRNLIEACYRADPLFNHERVKLVHSGGSSPDTLYSQCSSRLQAALGIIPRYAEARDVTPGCNAAVDGLLLCSSRLREICEQEGSTEPLYGYVIVGEAIATVSNQPDSTNYLLWGNGAVGLAVRYWPGIDRQIGILRSTNHSDGQYAHLTRSDGIGCDPLYLGMKPNATMGPQGLYGRELQEYILRVTAPGLVDFAKACGVDTLAASSHLCGHNPTYDGIKAFGCTVGFLDDHIHSVGKTRGNTSSASPFLNYHDAKRRGAINSGDDVFFVSFGAGFVDVFIHYKER